MRKITGLSRQGTSPSGEENYGSVGFIRSWAFAATDPGDQLLQGPAYAAPIALDRAGLVGADGPTHAGSFDLAYLGCLPNMVLMAPARSIFQ